MACFGRIFKHVSGSYDLLSAIVLPKSQENVYKSVSKKLPDKREREKSS